MHSDVYTAHLHSARGVTRVTKDFLCCPHLGASGGTLRVTNCPNLPTTVLVLASAFSPPSCSVALSSPHAIPAQPSSYLLCNYTVPLSSKLHSFLVNSGTFSLT